jgi:hypothetical protein
VKRLPKPARVILLGLAGLVAALLVWLARRSSR